MEDNRLEDILSSSEIKSQFYSMGYGLFTLYSFLYTKFGYVEDTTGESRDRFNRFKEAGEDVIEINRIYGGAAVLRYWLDSNADDINKRVYGDKAWKVNQMERKTIRNPMIKNLVYTDLAFEFMKTLINLSKKKYTDTREDVVVKRTGVTLGHVYNKNTARGLDLLKEAYFTALNHIHNLYNYTLV